MAGEIQSDRESTSVQAGASVAAPTESDSSACPTQGKGWIKGGLGMAICCAAPLLFLAAMAIFGFSSGAIATGAFSLVAALACPIVMFLMMPR